ncbi:MAG: helix-turn-helix transcriptional regulator [Bacteroidales bacterium]|nr:helix-turn-helix transcriptional regulator [Bacteroidales bacterium]
MDNIQFMSTIVMGQTMGATLIMATFMFAALFIGHNTRWKKHLLGMTGITMLLHVISIVYRIIVSTLGNNDLFLMEGATLFDILCIATIAVIEVMLTKHMVLRPLHIAFIYAPFIIFIVAYFTMQHPIVRQIALGFTIVASIFWAIMTYRDMRRYNKSLKQAYSDIENRDLRWLTILLILMVVALVIWSSSTFINSEVATMIYRCCIIFIWFYLCLQVYRQKEASEIDLENGASRYGHDAPADPNVFMVGKHLEEYMRTAHPFLKHDVTSRDIAEELNCSTALIAQYFTSKGTTFHAYINDRRLDFAIEQLLTTNCTIVDLANSIGYRFDNDFFIAFQRKFGCTPQEYRSRYKIDTNNK